MPLPSRVSDLTGFDLLLSVTRTGSSGVPAAELARTPLLSREAGSGTRRFLEEALRAQAGLERVPPAAELSSTTAIKAAVAAGEPGPARRCSVRWPSRRSCRPERCARSRSPVST